MHKSLSLLLIVFVSMLAAGIYGSIHDQITYSVSSEYYTRFKFQQFGFEAETLGRSALSQRLYAAVVGFRATWWVGFFIGLVLGLFALRQPDWRTMLRVARTSIKITLVVALVVGIIGLVYGYFVLSMRPLSEFRGCLLDSEFLTVLFFYSGIVLEKVCEYFIYNEMHQDQANVADIDIPAELCLELLMAADYLDT